KPERLAYPPDSSWNKAIRDRWWQFGLPRPALFKAITMMQRVLVRSAVSNLNCLAFVPTNQVFSHATKVFLFDDNGTFALLQSSFHTVWLEKYKSTMRTDVRYTPETCFAPFPFPKHSEELMRIGGEYDNCRRNIMIKLQEGLTKTYKRFNNLRDTQNDIQHLRQLHVKMDNAVATAYGWTDLDLGHDFHETKQGIRYTISEV